MISFRQTRALHRSRVGKDDLSGIGPSRCANADRVRLAQRVEESIGLADVRERLCVTQMRVHVHQPDLAAEVRRALGALKQVLRPAASVRSQPFAWGLSTDGPTRRVRWEYSSRNSVLLIVSPGRNFL